VELTQCRFDKVEAALAAAKGKVVLVDCWGAVVPAVLRQLPEAGREAREVRPKGLVCLSVSLDQGGRRSTPPECTRPEGEERSLPELLPDRLHSDNAKMEGGSARSPASRTRCCSAGPGEAGVGRSPDGGPGLVAKIEAELAK
jgi:hypothetical protein